MTRHLLFLCTGNYYRSRFAALYFNARAAQAGLDWHAESRGLALERGIHNVGPISPQALQVLRDLGVPTPDDPRPPQAAAHDDFAIADLTVALYEREHRPLMDERFPAWADRVEYWSVPDLDEVSAPKALPRLAAEIDALIERLAASDEGAAQ